MFTQCKKILGSLVVAGFLLPATVGVATAQTGVPSYYLKHYQHAKEVLQQELPNFLTEFQTLQEEIKTTDSSDQQAQFDALMRFFPSIEEMAYLDSYVANKRDENGVLWDLQTEVIVSFFAIDLPTADKNGSTSVRQLLSDAFMDSSAGADAVAILSEDTLMKKHNMNREKAQQVRAVLHTLYPTNALL